MLEEIATFLKSRVPSSKANFEKREVGDSVVFVEPQSIREVCQTLRDEPQYQFNVLQVITGCDFPPDRIEVSYVLASYSKNLELILKVKLPRDNPHLETVTSIWKAANFQERECYDMLGVTFDHHPDFRRILCPDDWEGFPLRKDYQAAKVYNGMEIYPVDKMNFPDREFAEKQKIAERAAKKALKGDEAGGDTAEKAEE